MIIDFHTHTFPDKIAAAAVEKLMHASHTRAFTDGTAAELQKSRIAAGIDRCVVLPVATSERQVPHINDAAIRMNESAKQTGLYSLGTMHPDFEGWHEELGRLAAAGIRGVKLHPPYQQMDIDDPRYLRVLTRAGELGLFVVIHAGLDVGLPGDTSAVPEKTARALRQTGPVTMVCAHMGGWRCWEKAADLLAPMGVLIDTAFSIGCMTPAQGDNTWKQDELQMLDDSAALRLIRLFGKDRVLFGTDSPWADQQADLQHFLSLPLSPDEQKAILSENAARLMGWQDLEAK